MVALQSLIDLSLEFGHSAVLEALPPEQRDLLDTIPTDGEDLAATALEDETRIFGDWELPPADKFFALTSGIMIGPQPKDKKVPQGKP
jgi:hypothetical protein